MRECSQKRIVIKRAMQSLAGLVSFLVGVRVFQHALNHSLVLLGGLVQLHGLQGLEKAGTSDAVVLSGAGLGLVDLHLFELNGRLEVIVDLVVVLAVVAGFNRAVQSFVLAFGAFPTLSSCHHC